ncbi:response regulator [Nocardioides sp. CN2-186]|uniref:response regulator n=1 Tax=Nocardioides tweenelious TaxID=3156607 RepID=UPI0032B59B41
MTPGEERAAVDPDLVRRLFASVPDGLWMFDDDGVTTFANERMAQIVGRTLDEMQGLPVIDLLDEQGAAQFRAHLARLAAGSEGEDNVETRFSRPDGPPAWALVSYAPVLDDDGNRLGWLHRVTSYTDRKQLVETLLEREHQLAAAQRIAHIGSWAWDVASDRIEWSDELYRIFGVELGTPVTYASYIEMIHPDDRHRAEASASADVDEYSFDHRVVRPDGSLRWVRGRGVVDRAPDGTAVRMSGTVQDITDLVTADDIAAEATRRLALLQQMAMAANRATSLREAVQIAGMGVPEHTSWNAVCAYLYVDHDQVEELDLGGTALADPDPDLAARARVAAEVVVGRPSRRAETHSLVALPVLVDGAVTCVIELLADEIPPDDNSYWLMDQIANQLSVVGDRERSAAQLAEARDDAMEASRLKSEFLATMSHEIRTPMNGVIGLTDLLQRTQLDEHQRRLTENLQGAGMTLLGIINDILDLSKIEAGKLELESADFDVRAVFDQVASVLSGPAHDKGLELVVACQPDVPVQLRGDPVRFGQIVTNLGSNAVKFTDHGEVVIEARVERQTPHDVVLRVDVTDTGVGIDPEERDRLFEAFTQADPSTTRRHGGTGLGLAISRQLVDAMNGDLWVTSETGVGSTFSFTAQLGRVAGAATRSFDAPQVLRGRRVLVVDDNATNRYVVEAQLAAWQVRPVSVGSAPEALATLREAVRSRQPFDVVLLDLVMPGVDGLELARQVRADPALAGTEMLLLSSDQTISRQLIANAGIHATLSKPVREAELHNALLGLLSPPTPDPRGAPTPGGEGLDVRVLVVEDNPVNQIVATGLLESLGCTADVVVDGIEAVERLTGAHGYDVVLMDCRMPRLDGFDATRQVRQQEPPGTHVPIIAMTASALEGERERCLAAGMDDYLTKPVDAAELEAAVREWAHVPASAAPAAPTPPPEAPTEHDGVLDPDRIRMLDGLVKDGTSFFQRTAASFMGRVGSQIAAIREAIDEGSANDLLTSAHQLKGSALNLGLPRVAAASARLEALGIAGRTDGTAPLLDDLVREVDVAVAALQQATAGRE